MIGQISLKNVAARFLATQFEIEPILSIPIALRITSFVSFHEGRHVQKFSYNSTSPCILRTLLAIPQQPSFSYYER